MGGHPSLNVIGKLNIHTETWHLNVDSCPCDVHFNDFIDAEGIRDAAIFHFGTGAHHVVGMAAAESGRNNAVLAITASIGEYECYVKLLVGRPKIGRAYKAYFGDIYQLDGRLLPQFDLVTLFHLCEYRTPVQDHYGALTDLEVTEVLVDRLKPDGRVLFYTGSTSFHHARAVIATLEEQQRIERESDFKTLRVYRKVPRPR
jgi:SAM-dependent methyltransferase